MGNSRVKAFDIQVRKPVMPFTILHIANADEKVRCARGIIRLASILSPKPQSATAVGVDGVLPLNPTGLMLFGAYYANGSRRESSSPPPIFLRSCSTGAGVVVILIACTSTTPPLSFPLIFHNFLSRLQVSLHLRDREAHPRAVSALEKSTFI